MRLNCARAAALPAFALALTLFGAAAAGPLSGVVVAVDPGHGGRDPGAVRAGLREADIVLAASLELAEALRVAGAETVLTRERDVFLRLAERVAIARAAGADLLLSIHADADDGRASGAAVYTLSLEASDAQAAALAARENAVDDLAGAPFDALESDVAGLLFDLVRREALAASDALGDDLVAAMGEAVEMLRTRPHRSAAFRVLKAPDTPSALIELGFLSDARDRARLVDPAWRARAAAAIVEGVARWARRGCGAERGAAFAPGPRCDNRSRAHGGETAAGAFEPETRRAIPR